ncbi:MAG TPA: hypothetical protein P5307_27765 [Pirellulaceae bacterium]|nr:hypothetical protein [Pirellulaceae bacterium]
MTTDIFRTREQALEYEFFHKVDDELWEDLRHKLDLEDRRHALADATGITDEDVLTELVELDLNSETLFALLLFPLVWVAWADGCIDTHERQMVLKAATEAGHDPDSASYHLIETWLDHEPNETIQTAWKDYVRVICGRLSTESRRAMRCDTLRRVRELADSICYRFGLDRVELAQDAVLHQIAAAM